MVFLPVVRIGRQEQELDGLLERRALGDELGSSAWASSRSSGSASASSSSRIFLSTSRYA